MLAAVLSMLSGDLAVLAAVLSMLSGDLAVLAEAFPIQAAAFMCWPFRASGRFFNRFVQLL